MTQILSSTTVFNILKCITIENSYLKL